MASPQRSPQKWRTWVSCRPGWRGNGLLGLTVAFGVRRWRLAGQGSAHLGGGRQASGPGPEGPGGAGNSIGALVGIASPFAAHLARASWTAGSRPGARYFCVRHERGQE